MRLSGFHMPRWWQRLCSRRYPAGKLGLFNDEGAVLSLGTGGQHYRIVTMSCGCGYIVYVLDPVDFAYERIGGHCSSLGGAIRQACRHARSVRTNGWEAQ